MSRGDAGRAVAGTGSVLQFSIEPDLRMVSYR